MFVRWYAQALVSVNLHPIIACDIRSYLAGKLGVGLSQVVRAVPKEWDMRGHDSGVDHTHVALEDAMEQGQLFLAALQSGEKV